MRSAVTTGAGVSVRLARHELTMSRGRCAGISVAGWGVPLVVINGFTAEGILYAQTTSRLVSMGFKVIAIDTPGHGRSSALPRARDGMRLSADFIGDALDELGVGPCLVLGHSTGGRIAAEVAVARPAQVAGLVLVDAIVGRAWDDRVRRLAKVPGFGARVAVETGVDVVRSTVGRPDPRQLIVLARSLARSTGQQAARPWRLLAPGNAILNAPASHDTLVRLRALGTPTFVIHGARDGLVPLEVGAAASRASGGHLIVVEEGGHFWLLQDPEVLPGIIGALLRADLGDAYADVVRRVGLDPSSATIQAIESTAYGPDAKILAMTPALRWDRGGPRRPPRLAWHVAPPA